MTDFYTDIKPILCGLLLETRVCDRDASLLIDKDSNSDFLHVCLENKSRDELSCMIVQY